MNNITASQLITLLSIKRTVTEKINLINKINVSNQIKKRLIKQYTN